MRIAARPRKPFAQLTAPQQDEVITALEGGKATGFTWPSAQAFFNTVRTHTMEGMFADPVYGGNKDFAGWQLIGFPGAVPIFSPQDMTSKEAQDKAAKLGLSAWVSEVVTAGEVSEGTGTKCVGFASIEFPLAESETWEKAFSVLTRLIFSA